MYYEKHFNIFLCVSNPKIIYNEVKKFSNSWHKVTLFQLLENRMTNKSMGYRNHVHFFIIYISYKNGLKLCMSNVFYQIPSLLESYFEFL